MKLAYYKSKGDKASKGELDLQRSEEALTIRRVPLEETTGASDELFQFEIFSPIGLAHKSKSPIMYFNVISEVELHEWLAPLKYGISPKSASSTKDIEIRGSLARSSVEDTGALGVSKKFRPQYCSEADLDGNTPLHLICKCPLAQGELDVSLLSIFAAHSVPLPPGHYLMKSVMHRCVSNCSTALWILLNSGHVATLLFKSQNEKKQSVLHMAGLAGNTMLCEALVATAVRACVKNASHHEDAALITQFVSGKDNSGRSPKSFIDARPLDVADISLSDSTPDWFDPIVAVNRAVNMTNSVSSLPVPPHPFSGLSYLTINFFSLDIIVGADLGFSVPNRYFLHNSVYRCCIF